MSRGGVDMLKLVAMIILIGYTGFKFNGMEGALTSMKNLFVAMWEELKILNIICVSITGDVFFNRGVPTLYCLSFGWISV